MPENPTAAGDQPEQDGLISFLTAIAESWHCPRLASHLDQGLFAHAEHLTHQGPLEVKPNSVPELVLASPPVPEVP
jgi:hypothetical protein